METPVANRLARRPAIVLERMARAAGATRWYYCRGTDDLPRLEARFHPGSLLSFYFDDRIKAAVYSSTVKETLSALILETREVRTERDPLVGYLDSDGIEIHMILSLTEEDLRDYHSELCSAQMVFFGEFPARDNDGLAAVTVTLPDEDGVKRAHPH